ncbi:caspase domain-containing protein [Mucor mucedo]|uniref:caspase domain-containing protein n=1 Tax=Mucor mucedo TaxID=29922 RepID=UPI00221E4460|nr:caspase domain-containing protein [Mucor mucedo]KAI7888416.1 caspase domain-containing protein [Mucor mucedo]
MDGNVHLMIYIESLETRLKKMEALLKTMQEGEEKKETVEMPKSIEHNKVVRYLGSSSGYYLVRDILSTDEKVVEEVRDIPNEKDPIGPVRFKKINVMDDDVMFVRDKTMAEHVDQLETDKLDLNTSIVSKSLLTDLITRFFEMDHASLPVVQKQTFMDAYEGRSDPPPATILIYAICTHVCLLLQKDDPIFINAGSNRTELFTTLADYTTNLVRKEYLTPRLATIQALILLCAYPDCDKSFYKNWLRAGMAVRMAQELGLHRTLEKLPLTDEMFEARKRLWYCTYITDRWCCAVMGRPLAISDADCDIELPHVNGGPNGNEDYSVFINFIKLSGILGEVLRRIYSAKAQSQGYKHEANTRCTEAAKSVVDIARLLTPSEVVHFGWNFAGKHAPTHTHTHTHIEGGYSVFQASLIHVYNCTSTNPKIASSAREYVKLSIDECIQPMSHVMTNAPPAIPLLQTLMDLIGTDTIHEETSLTAPTQQQQLSPMSVHAIVSDWGDTDLPSSAATSSAGNNGESFVQNNVSLAAWQSLFSSAATPFFENETDWQATLASLFDDGQNKPNTTFMQQEEEEQRTSYYSSTKTSHHTSSYSSNSYGYGNPEDDSNDPGFSEEDYEHPNPSYSQPPQSKHNPGPDPDDEDAQEFELSNCHGRKRALLIGINYTGTANELSDDQEEDKFKPTRANILAGMKWLVDDAQPDDSGHGGRVSDIHSDEDDSFDETIYPLDFDQFEGDSGQIKDDDMHDILVRPLPAKCRLTAIFDSCHSGTVLDLPYVYSTKGEIKEQNLFKHAGQGIFSAGIAYARGDKDGALSSIMSLGKQLFEARNISDQVRRKNTSQADVIMFSGCKDDQTSADAQEAGKATGAMSFALISK